MDSSQIRSCRSLYRLQFSSARIQTHRSCSSTRRRRRRARRSTLDYPSKEGILKQQMKSRKGGQKSRSYRYSWFAVESKSLFAGVRDANFISSYLTTDNHDKITWGARARERTQRKISFRCWKERLVYFISFKQQSSLTLSYYTIKKLHCYYTRTWHTRVFQPGISQRVLRQFLFYFFLLIPRAM